MIYADPKVRLISDSYIGVEFGDDADLRCNFRVIALVQALQKLELDWVVEVVPTLRELGVVFDRQKIGLDEALLQIENLLTSVSSAKNIRSRLFKLKIWYRDPWSEALNAKAGLKPSIEIVADANNCSVDEVIDRHSGTEHWLSCVGWAPGCYFAYPIQRQMGVTAPKLDTARPYTPERILALGGLCTAATPFPSPSGYQMLGRHAAPISCTDPGAFNFPDHGVAFHAGDRHQYIPVDALEYEKVAETVADGSFRFDMVEEDYSLEQLEAGGYCDP